MRPTSPPDGHGPKPTPGGRNPAHAPEPALGPEPVRSPVAAPDGAEAVSVDPGSVPLGGFPAWPLPPGERCAAYARQLAKGVFGTLGMPAVTAYDAIVAVSELATNVFVHADGGVTPDRLPAAGLPELWAYVRWRARPEVVLKVYDSAPGGGRHRTGRCARRPTRRADAASRWSPR